MASLAILIPTLGRPHLIAPLVQSIQDTTEGATILFLTTPRDRAVQKEIDLVGVGERIDVPRCTVGDYARKINEGYRQTTEDLLFLGAQDLKFHPNWLRAATKRLTAQVQVVGTNDMGNIRVIRGEHSTHTLVTRKYVDEFGTIDEPNKVLCEAYPHEFVDDEFVETARFRRAFTVAPNSRVEHLHPMWKKAPWDDGYEDGDRRFVRGRKVYDRRRVLWKPRR